MNAAILIDSLKYLTHRFIFVSRLSMWIQESLHVKQYSERKFERVLECQNFIIVKTLVSLVTVNESLFKPFIDDYCSGDKRSTSAGNIIMLFYSKGSQYKKKSFIEISLERYHYDVLEICDSLLLDQVLVKSIHDKRFDLCVLSINKGAKLKDLSILYDLKDVLPHRILLLIINNMDKVFLYQELVRCIKLNKSCNITYKILWDCSFLKDKALFDLVIKKKLSRLYTLFITDGFDPNAVEINKETDQHTIYVINKHKKWRI